VAINPVEWVRAKLYEDVRPTPTGRHTPRMPRFLPTLAVGLLGALLTAWLLFVAFARLGGSAVSPWSPRINSIPTSQVSELIKTAVTAAGLLAGVFAIVYAYRKQRVEEAASRRADEDQLSKRYQDAATQLGHEKAAVRLAGVYAMTRLAE
jgi:hypothetical protein